ncbi:MAG: helix-turn-helix transcriptional regulator [Chloroflexi bacterium]|nr:helix-turn-helix transcriptional regulator [Chloroflexota bacterium]
MSPTFPLLGLLARGEQHGYELKRVIDHEFASYWTIDFAQLYRSLSKMTRAGWIKARGEKSARGPASRVYTLTARGRRIFKDWFSKPAITRAEFFIKAHLAALWKLPADHLVQSQRQALTTERAVREQHRNAAQEMKNPARLMLAHAALLDSNSSLASLETIAGMMTRANPRARKFSTPHPILITGSDDLLLTRLAEFAHGIPSIVGSVNGLLALAKHEADVAGVHLLDEETGEYNIPFIKRLVPEDSIVLVNLAQRENGLMLARGNPKNIRGLRDLAARGIRFINRQRGAGTRLLLYAKLRAARIDPHSLRDWERAVGTHDAIAAAIVAGTADVGPGLRAVAARWGLPFILLGEERFDLAMPRAIFESARIQTILQVLHRAEFRRAAAELPGYDLSRMGRVIARVK